MKKVFKTTKTKTEGVMIRLTRSWISFALLVLLTGMLWTPGHAGGLYGLQDTGILGINTLVRIDTTTLAITNIGDVGVEVTNGGLAYDPNTDILYMVDGRSTAGLYSVDRSTGAASLIGTHGLLDLAGLAFDPNNNILYGSTYSVPVDGGALHTLNTGTAAATLVGNTLDFSGLGYDSLRDRLLGKISTAVHVIDQTNANPGAELANFLSGSGRRGFAYDSDLDRWWEGDEGGSLFSSDAFFGTQTQHLFGALPRLAGLAMFPRLQVPSPNPPRCCYSALASPGWRRGGGGGRA